MRQQIEKTIGGVTYIGEPNGLSCGGCEGDKNDDLCDSFCEGSKCLHNWSKKPTKQPETWVTIEGDNGTFLHCTEEFREKLINHPKVIAAYQESLVEEVKHSTSEQQGVGLKYDDNKLQYSLIPPFALAEMVKCLTFGAKKYAPENWKKVPNAKKRYLDATMRHIELFRQGEIYDKESGAHHLACAMTNLAFYLEFDVNPELKGKE